MPLFNATIADVVIGDDWLIGPMTYSLVNPATIQTAYLVIKDNPSKLDTAVGSLLITVTSTLTNAGQITDNGTISHICAVNFVVSGAQTGAFFKPGLYYAYAIKLVSTLGIGYTPEEGIITPRYRGVTSA